MSWCVLSSYPYEMGMVLRWVEGGVSRLSGDHLLQVQLALGCDDGQLVAEVVVDQVTDALKEHIFGADLQRWTEDRAKLHQ